MNEINLNCSYCNENGYYDGHRAVECLNKKCPWYHKIIYDSTIGKIAQSGMLPEEYKGMPAFPMCIRRINGVPISDFRKRHPKLTDNMDTAIAIILAISVVGISVCMGIIMKLNK